MDPLLNILGMTALEAIAQQCRKHVSENAGKELDVKAMSIFFQAGLKAIENSPFNAVTKEQWILMTIGSVYASEHLKHAIQTRVKENEEQARTE